MNVNYETQMASILSKPSGNQKPENYIEEAVDVKGMHYLKYQTPTSSSIRGMISKLAGNTVKLLNDVYKKKDQKW